MSRYDPTKHHRRSIRLKGYDYASPGTYFVTIVASERELLFENGIYRRVAESNWRAIQRHFENALLDEWIVMPNHLHGIIVIVSQPRGVQPGALGAIIGNFKSVTTRRINNIRHARGATIWQRNYYEHIVRNENELQRIREYIASNPVRWEFDRENLKGQPAKDGWLADEKIWFSDSNLKSSYG